MITRQIAFNLSTCASKRTILFNYKVETPHGCRGFQLPFNRFQPGGLSTAFNLLKC